MLFWAVVERSETRKSLSCDEARSGWEDTLTPMELPGGWEIGGNGGREEMGGVLGKEDKIWGGVEEIA